MARSSHYSGQLLVLRWELLVICWLSALALELLFALLLRCRDAAVYGAALLQMGCAAGDLLVISAYWQFCAEWQDRLITADMYWQFCAEWQDRPGIITLEIMRAR